MRSPTTARLIRTIIGSIAQGAALLALVGCSLLRSTVDAYETGPNGIARGQQSLREALMRSDYAAALAWREDDALLHALDIGASSYYASQFARSAAVLDSAALLADDRITNSVSGNALALASSDLARPYQARRTERLFIPYYAMLSYARLDQWEDAAVEARRLGGLLAQYAGERSEPERATHATLHYLSGVVFERAGEHADAAVAYRLARALLPEQVDSTLARKGRNEGEVLVVLERGFVAHRATETISVRLGDDGPPPGGRHDDAADMVSLASRAVDAHASGEQMPVSKSRTPHGPDEHDETGYWMRVSFPAVRRAPRVRGEASVTVDGVTATSASVTSLVDDAVSADEGRERTATFARATARAATKYAVTKAVKDEKGEVAGSIANIGVSLLERADVRSWHLLPQTVTLLRLRVPPGRHQLGVVVGNDSQHIDLGEVAVRGGEVTILATRLWREAPTERAIAMKP